MADFEIIFDKIAKLNNVIDVSFCPPLSSDLPSEIKCKSKISLGDDYWHFLQKANGMILSDYQILGCCVTNTDIDIGNDIWKNNKTNWQYWSLYNEFGMLIENEFVEFMSSSASDILGLLIRYPNENGNPFIGYIPDQVRFGYFVIASSFSIFLEGYIDFILSNEYQKKNPHSWPLGMGIDYWLQRDEKLLIAYKKGDLFKYYQNEPEYIEIINVALSKFL